MPLLVWVTCSGIAVSGAQFSLSNAYTAYTSPWSLPAPPSQPPCSQWGCSPPYLSGYPCPPHFYTCLSSRREYGLYTNHLGTPIPSGLPWINLDASSWPTPNLAFPEARTYWSQELWISNRFDLDWDLDNDYNDLYQLVKWIAANDPRGDWNFDGYTNSLDYALYLGCSPFSKGGNCNCK